MALATRCPHCHTTFRVANDQLKLRAGIVRCGECRQVFNGIEHLLPPAGIQQTAQAAYPAAEPKTGNDDVGGLILPGAAINRPASTPAATGGAETGLLTGIPVTAAHEDATAQDETDPDDALEELDYGALEGMTLMHFPPAEQAAQQDDAAPQEAPEDAQPVGENADPAEASGSQTIFPNPSPASERGEQSESLRDFHDNNPLPDDPGQAASPDFGADAEDDAHEPGFVTAARRQQRNERRTRLLFGAGSAILALVLLAQASYALRNQIAAHLPPAKPALLAICQALGCSIALPAQIDAITIESSELQTQPGSAGTLALKLLLRNRSSTAQAWPNIELTLNDGNERAILRRVFTPREFPLSAAEIAKGIAAGTEQSIRLSFKLSQLKASGYRVVLFYP